MELTYKKKKIKTQVLLPHDDCWKTSNCSVFTISLTSPPPTFLFHGIYHHITRPYFRGCCSNNIWFINTLVEVHVTSVSPSSCVGYFHRFIKSLADGEGSVSERAKFDTLLFVAVGQNSSPSFVQPLSLSVQLGADALECCRVRAGKPVRCQSSTVYWADIVCRFIRFPLPQVTELGEAQLLWLKTQTIPNQLLTHSDFILQHSTC